jgi:hypothetical protein
MLSIVSIAPLIAASAVNPYLIANITAFSQFEPLREKVLSRNNMAPKFEDVQSKKACSLGFLAR